MASSLDSSPDGPFLLSQQQFHIVLWVLCGLATLFLSSRFAVRMSTKGRLMANDYILVVALPALFIGAGVLQSALGTLYFHESAMSHGDQATAAQPASAAPRLTGAIELLWIAIYSVKFCFLAQFKFHKPPYAYVVIHLTRYYWASFGTCTAALLYTLIQPIILCPNATHCRYFRSSNTVAWELSVTVLDIVTDIMVVAIPIFLIYMASFTRSHTIINAFFKGLSIFSIAIAATRLVLQYNAKSHTVQYVSMTFLLAVEAAVAIIMASISSYRVPLLDWLAERRARGRRNLNQHRAHKFWKGARQNEGVIDEAMDGLQQESLSDIPMLSPARYTSSSRVT